MSDNEQLIAVSRTALTAHIVRTRPDGDRSFCRKRTTLSRAVRCAVTLLALGAMVCRAEAIYCDPNDPSTCRFGGVCKSLRSLSGASINDFTEDRYICTCPSDVRCYMQMPMQPICGMENGVRRNYFNEKCRRDRECLIQAPIKRLCHGICNEDCRPLGQLEPCNALEQLFCNSKGSICMIDRSTQNPQPLCRCFANYDGDRCQFKSTPRLSGVDSKTADSVNYRLGFYFCIGLLGLLLVLQAAYCVIARRRGYCPDNGDCCHGGGPAAPARERTELPATVSGRSN